MKNITETKIFAVFLVFGAAYIVIYLGAKYPTNISVMRSNHILVSKYSVNTSEFKNCSVCVNNATEGNHLNKPSSTSAYVEKRISEEQNMNPNDQMEYALVGKSQIIKNIFNSKIKSRGPQGDAPPIPNMAGGEDKLYVMLLAYQRSGSSFTGDLLNRNPAVFYVYEPLDALYSSLYGIPPGWSVPSDITGEKDGSIRDLPDYEVKAAADVISNLFECKFNNLPTEVLISQFWTQFWSHQVNVLDFTKCLKHRKVNVGKCRSLYLRRICPNRLGLDKQKERRCYNILHTSSKSNYGLAIIAKYTQCLVSETERAKDCFPMLQKRCDLSPVRGVKTVRATMEVVKILLERHQNLKVIHLIRDPRPVLLSRMDHVSYRAIMSKRSMITEARFFCNIVYRDLQQRKELEKKYQGRITEMIYEEFASHPLEKSQDIYTFLDLPFVKALRQWLIKNTHKSKTIAHAWENKMTKSDKNQIDEICKEVLNYGQKFWN